MASTTTSESSASQLLRLLANHSGVAEIAALDAPDGERDLALRIRDDVDRRRRRETELSALVDTARDLASLSDPNGVLDAVTRRARVLLVTDVLARTAAATVAGVGPLTGVDAVEAGFAEAVRTVRAMVALGHVGTGAASVDLGFAGLVVGTTPDIAAYVTGTLGAVTDYDDLRGTNLLGTLEAFFAAGCSPRHTATRLHVHVNTVAQRLERITALLGPTWLQPDRALEIQLALRLLRLMSG